MYYLHLIVLLLSFYLFVSVFSRVTFTEEEEEDEGQDSALLVELEGKDEKKERETDLWFSKVCASIIRVSAGS